MTSPARYAPPTKRRSPRRHRRAAIVAIVVCLLVAALVVLPVAHLVGQIDRIPVEGLAGHPAGSTRTAGSLDVLVVGTAPAGRSGTSTWLPGNRSPVSLMVMHVDADRRGVTMVGIPTDLKVTVPGDGRRPLADVASTGKPADLIATVESLTGSTVDHVAVLDWRAFGTLIDRLGGIKVSTSGSGNGAVSMGGVRMPVTGRDVLRTVSPHPDVDSVTLVRSQLGLIDLVVDGTLHPEPFKNPLLVYNFLDSVTQNLAVDQGWSTSSMARLFFSVLNLRSGDMKYVTVPVICARGIGPCRPRLDTRAASAFWSAVERDRIDKWLIESHDRGRVETSP